MLELCAWWFSYPSRLCSLGMAWFSDLSWKRGLGWSYRLVAQWSEYQRLKLEALGLIPSGCSVVLFCFSQLTFLCIQNWVMSMSALVQVAAITGTLVEVAAIISALVQFGRYHWCSSTVGCYHWCSST